MPTPEQYQRAENLRTYVRQEIEDLKAGKIHRLSSYATLSARFGYKHYNSARTILRFTGLLQERRSAEMEAKYSPPPSSELAWIVGLLAGGGYVNEKKGDIVLGSDSNELLQVFKSRGERMFKEAAMEDTQHKTTHGKTKETPVVKFFNTQIARKLGNLKRGEWQNTVLSNHRWILDQERYGWSFLEGFFEKRGGVYGIGSIPSENDYLILLKTSSLESVNFLIELMVRVGLGNPTTVKSHKATEGIIGVALYNLNDIKRFTANVHSLDQDKAAKLSQLQERESQRGRKIWHTEEEAIDDWIKAHDILGHTPTSSEIDRLKHERVLKCSKTVYIDRFGQGSFVKARENLERVVAEQRGRLRISPD